MKIRWLLAIALGSALVSGIWMAPAAYLYQWFAPPTLPIQVHNIRGGVGNGGAGNVVYQNRNVAQNLQWRLAPLQFAALRAGWHVRFGGPASGTLQVAISPRGAVRLRDVKAVGEVDALMAAAGYAGLPVVGRAIVDIDAVDIGSDGRPRYAEGEITVQALAWSLGRSPLELGGFNARLDTDDEGVLTATIRHVEGNPIEAEGTAELRPDGIYETHIKLRPAQDAPQQTRNLLGLIGRPDNQGVYHLRQRGRL